MKFPAPNGCGRRIWQSSKGTWAGYGWSHLFQLIGLVFQFNRVLVAATRSSFSIKLPTHNLYPTTPNTWEHPFFCGWIPKGGHKVDGINKVLRTDGVYPGFAMGTWFRHVFWASVLGLISTRQIALFGWSYPNDPTYLWDSKTPKAFGHGPSHQGLPGASSAPRVAMESCPSTANAPNTSTINDLKDKDEWEMGFQKPKEVIVTMVIQWWFNDDSWWMIISD